MGKMHKTAAKQGRRPGRFLLAALLLALPVAAGLAYVTIAYGSRIHELVLAGCKVVIVR